ncbi:class I SAM-dependent methyltransferase [uncultured Sphaerochaeta sp.]|uniref:class I SAM-dependent methyltransferase n=1 Tax=uncultured Sphaerochaeta sp. TaxID=886478 RepID=UPI0029CA63AF|nr:class I SAM-dependent methyltransferase [uncultured Sphaerochaeta sp.]
MRRMMLQSNTTCMRVYDRNLERFPVTVDLYGPYARITDYSDDGLDEEDERICCDIVSRMLYVQTSHVVFHRRPKRMGKEQHSLQSDQSLEVQVNENGLLFTVDLTKRIDTGLFLDHMLTRTVVEGMSRGCKVLNLFSYTGSFSVYAARGGAERVESVDLSSTYTAWAEKNLADNGFPQAVVPCIAADAWTYVMEAYAQGKKYDLIIFDPPSFSNSRKMDHDFDVQRDYLRWMKMLNALLAMGGKLVFSTNLRTFKMDEKAIRGFEIKEITRRVAAPGFTRRLGTARTWLLTKHEDIRIPDRWITSVQEKAGKQDQHDENGQEARILNKEVKKMKAKEKNEPVELETEEKTIVEEAANTTVAEPEQAEEDMVLLNDNADQKVEDLNDEDNELTQADEESVETETDEADDEEIPVVEPNEVEDDLLTLSWDDNDFAPLVQESSAEEAAEKRATENREPRRDDRRGERPSYSDRNDRRSRGDRPFRDRDDRRGGDRPFRDRDDRRPGGDRPSFRDRDDRRPGGDRPSFRDRDDRRPGGDRPSFRDRDDRRGGDRPSFRDRDDRRGGDRPSFRDRDDRRPGGDRPSFRDRDDRRPGGDRPSFRDRDDRRPGGDRPSFRDRDDRRGGDRPSFRDRDDRRGGDRPSFRDRDDRRGGDRPSFRDRDDRRPGGDRPSFRDRDDRRPGGDRPSFRDRDDRRPGGDRPSFRDRDDRRGGDRPSFRDRDDRRGGGRPSFRDRDDRRPGGDRPSFRDRDDRRPGDRPSFRDRDDRRGGDRPSFRDRDDRRPGGDRPSFRDRDDRRPGGRPSFSSDRRGRDSGSDERRQRKSGPKPYGFDSFRQTKTRGEHEDDPFMSE